VSVYKLIDNVFSRERGKERGGRRTVPFSQAHILITQSGFPPCAATYLLSPLKLKHEISFASGKEIVFIFLSVCTFAEFSKKKWRKINSFALGMKSSRI
jgi:hypothetical protein